MALTGKQRRFLRSLGHHRSALVQIGKEGLTEALVGAVDAALTAHELVKVRVGPNASVDKESAATRLAAETSSEVAQVLGNTVLLYRAHPEEPVLVLPRSHGEEPSA